MTTNSNETQATTQATAADSRTTAKLEITSPLPTVVDGSDFPTPGSTGSDDSGTTTSK